MTAPTTGSPVRTPQGERTRVMRLRLMEATVECLGTLRTLRSIDGLSARRPRSHHVEPVRFDLGGVRVDDPPVRPVQFRGMAVELPEVEQRVLRTVQAALPTNDVALAGATGLDREVVRAALVRLGKDDLQVTPHHDDPVSDRVEVSGSGGV